MIGQLIYRFDRPPVLGYQNHVTYFKLGLEMRREKFGKERINPDGEGIGIENRPKAGLGFPNFPYFFVRFLTVARNG